MRIVIDARMYGLEYTGIGRYLINLIEQLKKTKSHSKSSHNFVVLLRKKYYDLLTFPKDWEKVLVDIPHYGIREQLLLPSVINNLKPDLVHFPHINVPLLYKGKYVVTVHDITMQKQGLSATRLPLPLYLIKRVPFLFISKVAVKNAQKILTPSKTSATEVANYYKISIQKIAVTYEGFDNRITKNIKYLNEIDVLSKYGLVNKDYFFYVGNAYPHKNLPMVVRAIKDLNEKRKMNVLFVIAGLKDYFHQKMMDFANDIGAIKYVNLLGYIKDEELAIIYKNSLGFVYPSLAEGFGLQGLEAISVGTFVACSSIAVFKEIYGFHAFYFDPKSVDSISGTLYSLKNMSSEDKQKYIRNAQKFIAKYSWDKMAQETLKVYDSVV